MTLYLIVFSHDLFLPDDSCVAESLPAFIASHVTEKMCLPCKLVLPSDGGTAKRLPAGVTRAMQSGAGTVHVILLLSSIRQCVIMLL